MKFTIDAMKMILTTHRLKKNGSFEKFEDDPKVLLDDDMVFNSYQEAKAWKLGKDEVVIDGEKVKVSPGAINITDTYLRIRPHRTGKPKQMVFTKSDVEEVLRNGNDEIHNVLVVDWDGYVHLLPFHQGKEGYAVRIESFQAGNGYVGPKSRLNHLNNTYLTLLEGWLTHLKTHDSVYRDYPSTRDEEEILKDIQEAYNNL
jgi:hypothetical protein